MGHVVVWIGVVVGIVNIQIRTADRTFGACGRMNVGHAPDDAIVIAVTPAFVFHRRSAAVGEPVAVRAAGNGLQLVQGELLPVRLALMGQLCLQLFRQRFVHAGLLQQRGYFLLIPGLQQLCSQVA